MRNLTELSLNNRSLVWYFIIVAFVGGIFSYFNLGRMEDPKFVIREMIIAAYWPGATAYEMQEQVTDKLEKKLQDIPNLDNLRSETRPGKTIIYIELNEIPLTKEIRPTWRDVRNFCADIKDDLPEGVTGIYFNDTYDEVFGSIYALTGDGFSYEELRQHAENIRRLMLGVDDVKKIELVGEQSEIVYVEIEQAKLSELGISPQVISNTLAAQNAMTPAGMIDTSSDNVYLRVTGIFNAVDEIKNLPINAGGKIFRLADIAKVERKFSEPPEPKMFFNGKPAIGIAIAMEDGGNILKLGKDLDRMAEQIQSELPLGLELQQVSDQPQVVEESIGEFVETLILAIVIVLGVSFASLGLRTGMVVAGCIPLVLTGTFCFMYALGIDLHKVSLGSLIIALGLLVDDAIIAVEMMSVQLERGLSKFEAACHAFNVTAKPMLTGTLITCAGFIPVAFARGIASEFCRDMFWVVSIALILSWIVSVMVAPLFGTYIIKVEKKSEGELYQSRFYKIFRRVLEIFLRNKILVLSGTIVTFAGTIFAADFVQQEFFPPSIRPEVLIKFTLPEGSSMAATQAEAERFAKFLDTERDNLENYAYYVGQDTPRFVLTVSPKNNADNMAKFVITAKEDNRDILIEKIRRELEENFPLVRPNIQLIQTGPPADYPIMLRVSGTDVEKVHALAEEVAARVAQDKNAVDINLDWNEKSKVVKIDLDQDKLRSLGLTSQAVKSMLYTEITGAKVAEFYTGDRTIDIELRLAAADRNNLAALKNLPIYLGEAGYVPLEQIAKISYDAEYGLIKRRDLKPTITVQANILSGTANDAAIKALEATEDLQKNLPLGYSIKPGGDLEESDESTGHLLAMLPLVVFIIMTLLMFQLKDIKAMFLTLLTAPLGLIGVIFALIILAKPLGFVAQLGVIALSGMIIRNSVILIDQIQQHLAAGENPHAAIIDSAVLRFRPIMLTAAAAILGMLPLMLSVFWGPMAVAIAGGLLIATVLTLLVLPVMYAAVYFGRSLNND
ncbi:MAG: efflux RND transporter permease subunit [Selenomonadaceae bacterium]|nr:efflux RND transporter permease subunit [Selenomonadaceae bacterium]